MGAGQFEAGIDGAGDDPVATPSPPRAVKIPAALYLKGSNLDYPVNSAGLFQELHPVDAWVAHQLIVRNGTMASVPGSGQRLREITRVGTAKAVSKANDLVLVALDDKIANGDITVRKITVETPARGQLAVAVEYRNNRLIPSEFTTTKLTIP